MGNNDIYWMGRMIYAHICDLIESENDIKIKNTKNAEIFAGELRDFFTDNFNEETLHKAFRNK